MGGRRWTTKELEYLRNNYFTISIDEMAAKLKRSRRAIHTEAYELRLKKNQPKVRTCHSCRQIKRIQGKNLCVSCYSNERQKRIRNLWNGEKRLPPKLRMIAIKTENFAARILENEGFKDIWHISSEHRSFFCDYLAKRNGEEYFIDITISPWKRIGSVLRKFADRMGCQTAVLFISPSRRQFYLMTNNHRREAS